MKGFIEITDLRKNERVLVNVRHIEAVENCTIYLAFNPEGYTYQDYYRCAETYEQIKEKIREATE